MLLENVVDPSDRTDGSVVGAELDSLDPVVDPSVMTMVEGLSDGSVLCADTGLLGKLVDIPVTTVWDLPDITVVLTAAALLGLCVDISARTVV